MDATPAVLITENADQPYMKAKRSPYIFWKYTYWPPVSGNIALASAMVSAPHKVTRPATSQVSSRYTGDPSCEAIKAGFTKIPEPITPPTTIAMADTNPSLVLRPSPVISWFD